MASFNIKNFDKLMDQLGKRVDMLSCLESLCILEIPLEVAEKHQILEKIKKLAPYAPMTILCGQIIQKLEKSRSEDAKKKAKKEEINEKRRMARKRKSDENKESESKKMKLDSSGLSDQPADRELVASGAGKAEVAAAIKNKTGASASRDQKKAPKKSSLLQKCMKDAMKIKRQFK
ncbi:hypothetical protein CAEBREN_08023 [Caenorhabditis brenneri]|uniref:Uncharacterized protein n=1 Tax=Caenorhabditis brenneri TaxID=135651 RepID=G0PAW2_CAEBE|nr:hypothetical protein CAEBREN_08023 [Caenorhabditis brenneri]